MWKFETDHTVRFEQNRESGDEIIDIRNVSEHVISNDQICFISFVAQSLSSGTAEKGNIGGDSRRARRLRNIHSWLDTEHRHIHVNEVLQQIAVIACDFDHEALATEAPSLLCHDSKVTRMLHPRRRIG